MDGYVHSLRVGKHTARLTLSQFASDLRGLRHDDRHINDINFRVGYTRTAFPDHMDHIWCEAICQDYYFDSDNSDPLWYILSCLLWS